MIYKSSQQQILPYRDQSAATRLHEKWLDIPGMEGLFMVSNHGRVMRVERVGVDKLGRKFTTAQKIILPAINRSPNLFKKDYTYRFQIQIQIKCKTLSFQVQRIVYYCFVEPFDLKDRRINIIVKVGNGLDIRPENLIKVSLEEKVQRSFSSGRQLSPFEYNPEYKDHAVSASAAVVGKQVSSYGANGKKVNTYNSLTAAANDTETAYGNISTAVKCKWLSPGGLYWRSGDAEITKLVKRPKKDSRATHGKSVTKFDLNGNPIAVYLAISEAAKKNKISHQSISLNMNGKTDQAGGFIWKLGNHHENKR